MDLKKMKMDTLRSYDLDRLDSVSKDLRKELASLKMDIFTEKSKKSGSLLKLKRNLARSLTLIGEKKRNEGKA